MKRVMVVIMGLVLAVSVITVGNAAGVGQYCSDNGDFGVGHDSCVTCLNKGKGNFAACICKLYGDFYGYPIGPWKNQGDCVSDFKGL
jgi:hypothetical protein